MSETNHVIVIGAGAAGMLAAIAAAGEGAEVELWEQNEKPGKKLFITGKGRCNVTNACDMEELLGSVVSNSKFLYSSFYGFTNQDMMDLLEQAGLHPETMKEFDRPTPLKDGPDGLRNWAVQFFREDLKNLHEEQRIQIFKEMENSLKDELWDGSQWVADYRRIRVTAAR